MPSRILVVCTGNICRSPAAALMLDHRTDPSVDVASAGTAALVGHGVSGPMAALLQERGLRTDGFTARTVTADLVAGAALVVTMTRTQRSAVVRLEPRAVRRTFTLLELALLLGDAPVSSTDGEDDAARLARVPELAASRRQRILGSREKLDVPDPYGRSDKVYRRTLSTIESAVDTLAHVVHPPSATLGSWTPHLARGDHPSRPGPAAPPADGLLDGLSEGPDESGTLRHRVPRHGGRRRLW